MNKVQMKVTMIKVKKNLVIIVMKKKRVYQRIIKLMKKKRI